MDKRLRKLGAVAAVLLLTAGMFWLRWSGSARQAPPDTFWYTRQAVLFSGGTAAQATAAGSAVVCRARNREAVAAGRPPACHHYPSTYPRMPDPRYVQIFTTRPGFPLIAAPLIGAFGAWTGMALATLAAALLLALLAYAAVRELGGSAAGGLVAVGLLFLLPTGYWITRMLPEGALLAGYLATGLGVLRLCRGKPRSGLTLAATGLAWTFLAKPANGFMLAVVLLAAPALAIAWRGVRASRRRPRPADGRSLPWLALVLPAAVGFAGTLGWLVVSHVAHLPSFTSTIEDIATSHFRRRLVRDPIGWLIRKDASFWPSWLLGLARHPWPLVLVAVATAVLVWRCRAFALPWLLAGLTGPLILAAHPMGSEADRLMLPAWLPVVIGLAVIPLPRIQRSRLPWTRVTASPDSAREHVPSAR